MEIEGCEHTGKGVCSLTVDSTGHVLEMQASVWEFRYFRLGVPWTLVWHRGRFGTSGPTARTTSVALGAIAGRVPVSYLARTRRCNHSLDANQ